MIRQPTLRALVIVVTLGTSTHAAPIDPIAFQWATIGDPGNAPYTGPNNVGLSEVGSVPYEYRMSRLEVTSAQWVEFLNSVATYDYIRAVTMFPVFWGGGHDPHSNSFIVGSGDAAMFPVGGISWRDAARYVNWLHNDKADAPWALENGAYDTSTFGNDGVSFTDQLTHHPDARYWIPTLHEQFKAFYYDPEKNGPGAPGYWKYSHTSDQPPIGGPPGSGESTANWDVAELAWYQPLGAFENIQSPWGLWDTSGGAMEWNEWYYLDEGLPRWRGLDGAYAGSARDLEFTEDDIANFDVGHPGSHFFAAGLRVATRIPEPPSFLLVLIGGTSIARERRRRD